MQNRVKKTKMSQGVGAASLLGSCERDDSKVANFDWKLEPGMCYVALERLAQQEIDAQLYIADRLHSFRDVNRRISSKFEKFKQAFNNRKKRRRQSFEDFTAMDDISQSSTSKRKRRKRKSSSEDFIPIDETSQSSTSKRKRRRRKSSDDYVPTDETSQLSATGKRRKKKVVYEHDDEWNPSREWDGDMSRHASLRQRKSEKNLRITTRRCRIESESSSSSDTFFNHYVEGLFDEELEHGEPKKSEEKPPGGVSGEAVVEKNEEAMNVKDEPQVKFEGDILSKIMREMKDYNEKNEKLGKAQKTPKTTTRNLKPTAFKKRTRKMMKLTDKGQNIRIVKDVLHQVIRTVCDTQEKELAYSRSIKCKWCKTSFMRESTNSVFCATCKDTIKVKENDMRKKSKKANRSLQQKGKMMNKVIKSLPNYERKRLVFKVSKVQNTDSTANVPNVSATSKVRSERVPNAGLTKKRKTKRKSTTVCDSIQKDPAMDRANSLRIKIISTPSKTASNNTQITVRKIDRGLMTMSYPGPDADVELPKKRPKSVLSVENPEATSVSSSKTEPSKNLKYGTFLLPQVPALIVSNYAAPDANGDLYLSSVYYQNEMSRAKNVIALPKDNSPAPPQNPNVLPSMPSVEQLSNMFEPVPAQLPLLPVMNVNVPPKITISDVISCSSPYVSAPLTTLTEMEAIQAEQAVDMSHLTAFSDIELPSETFPEDYLCESDFGLGIDDGLLNEKDFDICDNLDSHNVSENIEGSTAEVPSDINQDASDANNAKESEIQAPVMDPNEKEPNTGGRLKDIIKESINEIEAISILSVLDLHNDNPKVTLNRRYAVVVKRLEAAEKSGMPEKEKAALMEFSEHLNCARRLINVFGSFTNISNHYLRQERQQILVKIKKEAIEEEETTASSCQFANSSAQANDFSYVEPQAQHSLHDLMNQINTISSNPCLDLVPYLPENNPNQMVAPMAMAQRSESRESASRGSGPITPSLPPESVTSQSEDSILTAAQIKREKHEASLSQTQSSPAQFAPTPESLTQMTLQLMNNATSQPPSYHQPHHYTTVSAPQQQYNTPVSAPQQQQYNPSVSAPQQQQYNTSVSAPQQQYNTSVSVPQQQQYMPNPTSVPHSYQPQRVMNQNHNQSVGMQSTQTLSRLLNDFASQSINNLSPVNMTIANRNGMVNVQQVYLPRHGVQQRLSVQPSNSSLGMINQLVLRQNPVTTTALVVSDPSRTSYPSQSVGYNSQHQIQAQAYNNYQQQQPQFQQGSTYMVANNQRQVNPEMAEMYCALCGKAATLRCKQCAKVAYCDTTCAKAYWHTKHKQECQNLMHA